VTEIAVPQIDAVGVCARFRGHGDGELVAGAAARKEAASPRAPIDHVGVFAQQNETVCVRERERERERAERERE
jgi:hypothetical protein